MKAILFEVVLFPFPAYFAKTFSKTECRWFMAVYCNLKCTFNYAFLDSIEYILIAQYYRTDITKTRQTGKLVDPPPHAVVISYIKNLVIKLQIRFYTSTLGLLIHLSA